MKALDFPLLADENVHPDVIAFLRKIGLDVDSVAEQGQFGIPDTQVLENATDANRVVLTKAAILAGWLSLAPNLPGSSIFALDTFAQTLQ